EEFNALDKWLRGILRLFENAPIERKPAQLAVDKVLRIAETVAYALDNLRNRGRTAFFFSVWSGRSLRHVLTIADQPRIRNAWRQAETAKPLCLISSAAAV